MFHFSVVHFNHSSSDQSKALTLMSGEKDRNEQMTDSRTFREAVPRIPRRPEKAGVSQGAYMGPDDPAILFRSLHFCVDARKLIPQETGVPPPRDLAIAANDAVLEAHRCAHQGPSFQLTPREPIRDLVTKERFEMPRLNEKHLPEFLQIIPAIVAGLQQLIEEHSRRPSTNPPAAVPNTSPGTALSTPKLVPNMNAPLVADDWSCFNNPQPPELLWFAKKLSTRLFISPASLLSAVILLDRLCYQCKTLCCTHSNIVDLLFVLVRIASKVVELRSLSNKHFCDTFRKELPHYNATVLNEREMMVLVALRFDVMISKEDFWRYARKLHPSNSPEP
jgi:hypothetical protein